MMLSRSKRSFILFMLLLVWFAVLITWALTVSQVELETSLQVRGSQQWIVKQPGVLRIVGLDLKIQRPTAIEDVKVRWARLDVVRPWQKLKETPNLVWQGQITAPKQPGDWQIETSFKLQGKVRIVSVRVKVDDSRGDSVLPAFRSATPVLLDETEPSKSIGVTAMRGDLKRGFDNQVYLTVPAGISPAVNYKDLYGKVQRLAPKPLGTPGQFSLKVRPELPSIKLEISDGEQDWVWHEDARAAFFDVQKVETASDSVRVTVKSRDGDRNYFVDLWCGEQWLATTLVPGDRAVSEVYLKGIHWRETDPPLWVQAYRNPFTPGELRGGQYLLHNKNLDHIQNQWLGMKANQVWRSTPPSIGTIAFIAGQLTPPPAIPALLIDSAQAAVPEMVESRRFWLRIAGTLLGLSTLAMLTLLLASYLRHRKRVQVRLLSILDEDEMDGETDTNVQRAWFDVAMTLAVMGLFLGGITWLFLTAKWG